MRRAPDASFQLAALQKVPLQNNVTAVVWPGPVDRQNIGGKKGKPTVPPISRFLEIGGQQACRSLAGPSQHARRWVRWRKRRGCWIKYSARQCVGHQRVLPISVVQIGGQRGYRAARWPRRTDAPFRPMWFGAGAEPSQAEASDA
jgi:hypothetical protein